MLRGFISRYYAADGGGTGGAGDEEDKTEGKVKPSDILARYGQTAESALRMAEKLAESENSNYQLREKNRTLRQDVTDLKSKAPAEGARVLTKEEAAAFEVYVALGKPSELKTSLDAATTATTELATLRRKAELHDVQQATGFDPDVLAEIGPAWTYRIADEQVDGEARKVVYVKEGDQEQRIDQHPKVQKFKNSLLPDKQSDSTSPPPPRNTVFLQQHSGGPPAGDKADQFIKQQEERRKAQPNPLMKAQGA